MASAKEKRPAIVNACRRHNTLVHYISRNVIICDIVTLFGKNSIGKKEADRSGDQCGVKLPDRTGDQCGVKLSTPLTQCCSSEQVHTVQSKAHTFYL